MSIPSLSDLESTARKVVYAAMDDGALSDLTTRKVRDKVEAIHGLKEGTLHQPKYKNSLKAVILDTSEEVKAQMKGEEVHIQPEAKEGKTSFKKRQAGKGFKSAEFIQDSSDLEDLPESKPETLFPKRSPKKDRIKSKDSSKPVVKNPPPQKRRKTVVDSDNESEAEKGGVELKVQEVILPSQPKAKPSSKKRRKIVVNDDGNENPKDDKKPEPKPASHKSSPKKRPKVLDSDDENEREIPAGTKSKTKATAADDSDMSSLFGDSLKKKKARTSGEKLPAKKAVKGNSKGESSSGKHEETIKKLKSFVNACGVRKPWIKIFKDIPKPTQQITKLREILTDLGMTGRMSLEQAKRIKADRELAKELEDVQSFEQSVLNRSRSRTASTSQASIKPAASEGEESEEDIQHRRRKVSALRSIEAFLGSDSDD
ncbi:hypothetical protein DXG01_006600 [Tephrocybe rancida]|nr:hypothetical protein DXG01_006600 [Tephrocybe rancida]